MQFTTLSDVTAHLDEIYSKDFIEFKQGVKKQKQKIQGDILILEQNLIKDWNSYKFNWLRKIIKKLINSDDVKICLCDFLKERSTTIEFWIRVAFDLFDEEYFGSDLIKKVFGSILKKASNLLGELQQKKWPMDWENITEDSCLNLEIIIFYIEYIPMRLFIAQNIRMRTNIIVDIYRMPYLMETRTIPIKIVKGNFFPSLEILGPKVLKEISNSSCYFCQQLKTFISEMEHVFYPILQFLNSKKSRGRVVNIFGIQSQFIFNALNSLQLLKTKTIVQIHSSLRIKTNYRRRFVNGRRNLKAEIILTQLKQSQLSMTIMNDIINNFRYGYTTFISETVTENIWKKRLVLIFSLEKLKFSSFQDKIEFYQLPDKTIEDILSKTNYKFLIFFTNALYNQCKMHWMLKCKSKANNLMIIMWAYILADYFIGHIDIIVPSEKPQPKVEQQGDIEINFNFSENSAQVVLDQDQEEDFFIDLTVKKVCQEGDK